MNAKWYLEFDNGTKVGPVSTSEAREQVSKDAEGFVWRDGFSDWKPIA